MTAEPEYQLLGPAEQEIASQIRTAVAQSITNATRLLDGLVKIDLDDVESVLLDSKKREAAIAIVKPLQGLATNLASSELAVFIASVFLTDRKVA